MFVCCFFFWYFGATIIVFAVFGLSLFCRRAAARAFWDRSCVRSRIGRRDRAVIRKPTLTAPNELVNPIELALLIQRLHPKRETLTLPSRRKRFEVRSVKVIGRELSESHRDVTNINTGLGAFEAYRQTRMCTDC